MWIEIWHNDENTLFNGNAIHRLDLTDTTVWIDSSDYEFDNLQEARAFYEGFKIALNGLDCTSENWFIKPLKSHKQEAMIRRLMLSEALGDSNI